MNKIAIAAILFLAQAPAYALYQGRLDLSPTVEPFYARSFTAAENIGGVKKRLWHFDKDGAEQFRLSPFVSWSPTRIIGGAALGFPGGGIDRFIALIDQVHNLPTSVTQFGGYLSYLKTGVLIGYDPSKIVGIRPAFIGYSVSLGL